MYFFRHLVLRTPNIGMHPPPQIITMITVVRKMILRFTRRKKILKWMKVLNKIFNTSKYYLFYILKLKKKMFRAMLISKTFTLLSNMLSDLIQVKTMLNIHHVRQYACHGLPCLEVISIKKQVDHFT